MATTTLLCVRFRDLLPTEEVLRFARVLWEAALRETGGPLRTGDATLCIRKTDSKMAPYEASLALEHGSLQSLASGLDPLAAVQAAFAQLSAGPGSGARLPAWSELVAPAARPSRRHTWQPKLSRG